MADTAVAITAGAGTNIDTRTESTNLNHRQVVVLGDPSTNDGVAPVDGTAGVKVNLGADNDVTLAGTGPLLSAHHFVAAASANAANVKASAGTFYGFDLFNAAAYPVYLKLHNTAGTPTAGAGVIRTFGVQAGVRAFVMLPGGLAFGTGIGITVVKDLADAGTTATAANDAVGEIFYV